jgi:hypothetical protein
MHGALSPLPYMHLYGVLIRSRDKRFYLSLLSSSKAVFKTPITSPPPLLWISQLISGLRIISLDYSAESIHLYWCWGRKDKTSKFIIVTKSRMSSASEIHTKIHALCGIRTRDYANRSSKCHYCLLQIVEIITEQVKVAVRRLCSVLILAK